MKPDNTVNIKARLRLRKTDDSDITLLELLAFSDAVRDLAVEHGLRLGGTVRLCREDEEDKGDKNDLDKI